MCNGNDSTASWGYRNVTQWSFIWKRMAFCHHKNLLIGSLLGAFCNTLAILELESPQCAYEHFRADLHDVNMSTHNLCGLSIRRIFWDDFDESLKFKWDNSLSIHRVNWNLPNFTMSLQHSPHLCWKSFRLIRIETLSLRIFVILFRYW